jgi:bidirectional [NiFe] hydrogenase diaphorase subunit
MRRLGSGPGALIEALHAVQESFGFLDTEALAHVAGALRLPPSRVYGVATFYSYFTLEPVGEHTCVVCTGTACHINGARGILDAFRARWGLGPGETTADGRWSLLTARCVGSCSLAPVILLDGALKGRITPAGALAGLAEL